MKKKNGSFVHLLHNTLLVLIVFSYFLGALGAGFFAFNLSHDQDGLFYRMEVPFYFRIAESDQLLHLNGLDNKVKIDKAIGYLSIENPPLWQKLLFVLGIGLFKLGIFIVALHLLRKITGNIIDDKTFHTRNIKYITFLGFLLLFYSLVIFVFEFSASKWFIPQLDSDIHFSTEIRLKVELIIAGLFALVLGFIFKEGYNLQEENQLTV